MKISCSVTDFAPLFLDLEYVFKGLQATGVDGVELVIGVKSRWSVGKVKHLSQKYNLPITSIHQPVWSGLGLYFDEGFFDIATQLGAKTVVCHPLPRYSFNDKQMQEYLQRLSDMKERKGLEVLLENMPEKYDMNVVGSIFPLSPDMQSIEKMHAAIQRYNLKINLDIDHLQLARPHKESWFKNVLPDIGNIHLSSFTSTQNHMPLSMGDFQVKEFMHELSLSSYKGLLTFEIYYPKAIDPFSYDFSTIKKSVEFLNYPSL